MSRRGGRGGGRGGRGGARGAPRAPVWTPNPELYAQTNPEFGPGSQRIRIVSQEPALETKAALERSLCLLETGAREVVNDNSGNNNNNNNAPAPKLPERQDNNNTEEVKVPDTVTSNGDAAFTTSGDPSVDLFFGGMVRGAGEDKILSLLQASWAKNPQLTMQILLHGRDCRGGKGEKEVVLRALLWLRMVKPRTYLKNLRRFLDVGSYKDLVVLAERAIQLKLHPLGMTEPVELELLAEELKADAEKFRQWNEEVSSALEKEEAKEAKQEEPAAPDAAATDSEEKEDPKDKKKKKAARVSLSLACKWAPSEGAKFDRSAHLAKRLAKLLFPNQGKVLSLYRKFLTPLRTHCHIVEQLTCAGQWERINFGAVPAKAHNLLKKAFVKHTPEKYAKYIERLKVGKEKINTQGIQPHELAGQYVKGEAFNETIEAQWKTMIDKLKASGVKLSRALSLVDVSGSMSGTPMEVAIALGLVTATVCESAFHNMVLTFESNPHFFQIKEGSLFDKVNQLRQAPWGNSTNVLAAFDMILQTAVQMQVPADEMPHTLFIYSDMQFDTANSRRDNTETTFDVAKRNFAAAGYELPQVVFWNLRGDTHTLPTRNQAGVALVSGFSADLLKVFMEGGDFSPMAVLLRAVGKYEAEVDASEM